MDVRVLDRVHDAVRSSHRREANLLWYGPSRVFGVGPDDDRLTGIVRIALRDDVTQRHGLIADLRADDTTTAAVLIRHAEEALASDGVTKIDAIVPDGQHLSKPFLDAGYWVSRKTVLIRWDLTTLPPPDSQPRLPHVDYETTDHPEVDAVTDFILQSYQPYWRWWKNDLYDRVWERTDYPAHVPDDQERETMRRNRPIIRGMVERFGASAPQRMILARRHGRIVGLCDAKNAEDEQFEWGVLMTREHPGKGFGRSLALPMLHWLKGCGRTTAQILTTSGLDDYDPTVYLYVQSCGGHIVAEFLNLVKHPIGTIRNHQLFN